MKALTTKIARIVFVSALFASTTAIAEQAEQPDAVVQMQTEVAKELTEVKANLVQDLQQQLTDNIKQHVKSTVSNIADSVKAILP